MYLVFVHQLSPGELSDLSHLKIMMNFYFFSLSRSQRQKFCGSEKGTCEQ